MKDKQIIVDEKNSELFSFLRKKLSNLSKNNVKSLLTNGLVLVNNKVVTKYNHILNINDRISFKKEINTDLVKDNINILYEDNDIIVVDKPSGVLMISTDKEKEKTIYNIVSNYLKRNNKNNRIYIVHRLDKDTSGVVLLAKNEKIKSLLQNDWNSIAKRKYVALVIGNTSNGEVLKSYLKEDKNLYTYISKTGDLAITEYKKIKSNNNYSLLEIEIKTGKKNQIRVQLSSINHPIAGDSKYGIKDKTFKRMMLHAEKLEIIHPITKKTLMFTSPTPKEFYLHVK